MVNNDSKTNSLVLTAEDYFWKAFLDKNDDYQSQIDNYTKCISMTMKSDLKIHTPDGKKLNKIIENCGYTNAKSHALTMGIASIYTAEK